MPFFDMPLKENNTLFFSALFSDSLIISHITAMVILPPFVHNFCQRSTLQQVSCSDETGYRHIPTNHIDIFRPII